MIFPSENLQLSSLQKIIFFYPFKVHTINVFINFKRIKAVKLNNVERKNLFNFVYSYYIFTIKHFQSRLFYIFIKLYYIYVILQLPKDQLSKFIFQTSLNIDNGKSMSVKPVKTEEVKVNPFFISF